MTEPELDYMTADAVTQHSEGDHDAPMPEDAERGDLAPDPDQAVNVTIDPEDVPELEGGEP